MAKNYYQRELDKIGLPSEYPPTLKISGENGSTKWLSLNEESAKTIRKWLKKHYPSTKPKKEPVEYKPSHG